MWTRSYVKLFKKITASRLLPRLPLGCYSHSSDHGPALSAYWPDPGPDGSSDFYEDQFRLRDAGSIRPASPYDADRQRALLEGTFHRAPVQQLSLTSPTNDPAPCSILESCSALSRLYKDFTTITWTVIGRLLENLIDRSTLSTAKNDVSVNVSKIAINQLERLPSDNGNEGRYLYKPSEPLSLKSKHLTYRTAAGLG
ncbi:hypothetical protein HPB49_017994 [Dermacentor silvarum]|uniref:Uncharacterized protein n=1 Tax=Dermacentor silvarum TaxID=543639 RepID=A0ACB8CAT2_DERSI|nr:hypothetical protein HPB49_017994 [Dermacentor silvarum]